MTRSIMHFSLFLFIQWQLICYITKLQGATYILQKINRGEAPANNILQVCALELNTGTLLSAFSTA